MLGAKRDSRESVHGSGSCLPSNIGLEAVWGLHDSGLSKTHTRLGGVSEEQLLLVLS